MMYLEKRKMDPTRKNIMGVSAVIAPFGFVAGWIILIQRAEQAPDAGWSLSHLFLLVGVILFVPAIAGLRYLLSDKDTKTADIGICLSTFGIFALVGQFAIDLAIGQLANNASEMSSMFRSVYSAPLLSLPFQIMAILFYIGLFMLILLVTRFHLIPQWAGILAIIGIVGVVGGAFSGIAIATLLGFIGLWVGFIPIGLRILSSQAGTSAPG